MGQDVGEEHAEYGYEEVPTGCGGGRVQGGVVCSCIPWRCSRDLPLGVTGDSRHGTVLGLQSEPLHWGGAAVPQPRGSARAACSHLHPPQLDTHPCPGCEDLQPLYEEFLDDLYERQNGLGRSPAPLVQRHRLGVHPLDDVTRSALMIAFAEMFGLERPHPRPLASPAS